MSVHTAIALGRGLPVSQVCPRAAFRRTSLAINLEDHICRSCVRRSRKRCIARGTLSESGAAFLLRSRGGSAGLPIMRVTTTQTRTTALAACCAMERDIRTCQAESGQEIAVSGSGAAEPHAQLCRPSSPSIIDRR